MHRKTQTWLPRTSVALLLGLLFGCGGDSSQPTASVVAGALDSHCQSGAALKVSRVEPSACHTSAQAGSTDGSTPSMHGMDGEAKLDDYGETMFNSEGADDGCKYKLSFAVDPGPDGDTLTLKVAALGDGSPVTGAGPSAEAFMSATHPAPNAGQRTSESQPGTYVIGPVRFDAPGRWTLRFHLFEECDDSETSPHAHGAFYVDVP